MLLNSNSRVATFVKQFQNEHADRANDASYEDCNDLDDPVDYAMVVMSLPRPLRVQIGGPIVESIRHKQWMRWGSGKALADLEDEVQAGKCALVVTPDGS